MKIVKRIGGSSDVRGLESQVSRSLESIDQALNSTAKDVEYLGNSVDDLSTTTSTIVADGAAAPPITSPSCSESGYTIDGVVFSEVTATFTAPSPLGTFSGIFLVVKNYRGSTELVKVSEYNFTGAAGASASFKTTLQRTGETITVYFVSKNGEDSGNTWSTSPSATVTLDGNASAPTAPTGLTATSTNTGIALSWNANAESNLSGYKVYRGTTNVFGSSTLLKNLGTTRSGASTYFDETGSYVIIYYYWVTAVNTASQESSASSSVSAVSGGSAVTGVVVQGNFGYTQAGTSVTVYWDGTNLSSAFTLRLADTSTKSIPTGSSTITGLIAGNSYKLYPYYDVLSDSITFATGGTGSPAIAFATTSVGGEVAATTTALASAAVQVSYAGRVALAFTSITTLTSGGGGTGGGGGDPFCIAPWMEVESDRGVIAIEDLKVGDSVTTPQGMSKVIRLKNPPQITLVKFRLESGHTFECSPTHPIALFNGRWRHAGELLLADRVITADGDAKVVEWSAIPLRYTSVLPSLEPFHEFYCNGVLTHNRIGDKY